MPKPIILIAAIVGALVVLLSPSLMAQSKSDGDRLVEEALQLTNNARSNEDLRKAVEKYEEALEIYR